jgi:hypothetical protein
MAPQPAGQGTLGGVFPIPSLPYFPTLPQQSPARYGPNTELERTTDSPGDNGYG